MADRLSIAVIDGNSLMHRAFHAVSANMTSPAGDPTNAVFGFMQMFLKLAESYDPWGIVVCFDKGKPQVRMDMLPQYKAQRPPMNDDLRPQFPMVKDLLAALAVPVVELEGWEGDDLLGTLARQGSEAGYEMLLVTGDRDMYQLSSDHVKILSTRKGMSDVAVMTPEAVADLYGGITPDLVPDFYGLKGDSSDNIPGVPGIGPKKAQQLIEKYGSLDGVIAHADEVKGKMGENLRAHIDDALVSRKVATILTDAPVDVDFSSSEFPSFDVPVAREAFAKLGFTGVATRVLKLVDKDAAMAEGEPAQAAAFALAEPVSGQAASDLLTGAIERAEWLGVAMGEAGADGAAGSQTSLLFDGAEEPRAELWVQTDAALLRFEGAEARNALVRAFAQGRVASCDVKAQIHSVYPLDSSEPALLSIADVHPGAIFDCGVAAYLLDSSKGEYGAAALAEEYLNASKPEGAPEGAFAAAVAKRLVEPLRLAMDKNAASPCFDTIEMPLVPVLAEMERMGMHADASVFHSQAAELKGQISELASAIFEAAGEKFNIDSPMQLSHVLFDVMGLPTVGLKKTKRGFYSTNAKILDDLSHGYEVVRQVLDYREKNKILKTYLEALPKVIDHDGRIHTTLNQTVTATGRLSSSNPNLQNIPVRSELGRAVRLAFTVPDDSVFLAVDYSQIELRLLAHLSGDEHLVAAFKSGEDFHAETAARVFGVPVSEVTPELRSRAKAVNFGIVYGQQAYGLSQSLGIPMGEAQAMIDSYYAAYPGVRAFLDRTVEEARRTGFASTLFGRRRLVPDMKARNAQVRAAAERTAMNHPMQGTAADIIKIAMARVQGRLNKEGLRSKLVMQIHDELDLQVPKTELEYVQALVQEEMEGVVELRVPLVADASHGDTWADAK